MGVSVFRASIDDIDTINAIMRDDSVYPYITDDDCPKDPLEFNAADTVNNKDAYFIMERSGGILFMFLKQSASLWCVHTCVLPEKRGRQSVRAGIETTKWMFNNTPCKSIMSYIPEYNKPALMFAHLCGYRICGEIANGFLKDGNLQKLIVVNRTV